MISLEINKRLFAIVRFAFAYFLFFFDVDAYRNEFMMKIIFWLFVAMLFFFSYMKRRRRKNSQQTENSLIFIVIVKTTELDRDPYR